MTDVIRAFAERFEAAMKMKPNSIHAGNYSAVGHHLRAVDAAGTPDPGKVAEKRRELPVEDFFTKGAKLREDGVVMRDLHLWQVKKPSDVRSFWDLCPQIGSAPGADAYWPLDVSTRKQVKKS